MCEHIYLNLIQLSVCRCSSLFKQNKNDFEIICRYIIEDLVELISLRSNLRDGFMVGLKLSLLRNCKYIF